MREKNLLILRLGPITRRRETWAVVQLQRFPSPKPSLRPISTVSSALLPTITFFMSRHWESLQPSLLQITRSSLKWIITLMFIGYCNLQAGSLENLNVPPSDALRPGQVSSWRRLLNLMGLSTFEWVFVLTHFPDELQIWDWTLLAWRTIMGEGLEAILTSGSFLNTSTRILMKYVGAVSGLGWLGSQRRLRGSGLIAFLFGTRREFLT